MFYKNQFSSFIDFCYHVNKRLFCFPLYWKDVFYFISNSDETTEKLEFSVDVLKIIENNVDVKELSDKQINGLLKLMISWTELMQNEMNTIKDIEVSNSRE